MSRYLGPIHKKSKRLNISLLENNREFKKRKQIKSKFRKRLSPFGIQLNEKQKFRFRYCLTEKQLRNFFNKIRKLPGEKGENLLFHLEKRLDNLVFRAGWAPTRKAARQIVNHKQILVNNRCVDIPSYLLEIGDIVTIKSKKLKKKSEIENFFKEGPKFKFLDFDSKNFAFKLKRLPNKKDILQDIKLPLIVEYYNRYL